MSKRVCPTAFKKNALVTLRADYELQPDNTIGVTNQCRAKMAARSSRGRRKLSTSVDPRDPGETGSQIRAQVDFLAAYGLG